MEKQDKRIKMKTRKEIKKHGNSIVLVLSSEDLRLHNFEVGDVVDVEITKEEK